VWCFLDDGVTTLQPFAGVKTETEAVYIILLFQPVPRDPVEKSLTKRFRGGDHLMGLLVYQVETGTYYIG
jgi:hypothetical protein